MSVTTQNNILDVFVAKNTAPTAGTSMTSDLATSIAEGQIVVTGFDAANNMERALNLISATPTVATTPYIRFVQKINGELYYGSKIYGKDIVAVSTKATASPTEQIWSLGFNGTSGSLDVSQATDFILTIAYDHDDMMWSEQKLRNAYDYYSTAPTQQNLAVSMVTQINYKEYLGLVNGTGRMVKAELFNSANTAATSGAITASLKNGSDICTFSGAANAATATVGAILRLGSTGGGVTSAIPVYIVTEVNNTAAAVNGLPAYSVRLNTPFQGTTVAALNVAGVDGGVVTAGVNWGLTITGLPLTWRKDFFKYMKVKFHFDLKGFGASTVTKTAESYKGIGYFQEVAELESFASGNQGALNRMVVPLPTGRIITDINTAAAASGYDQYNVWYIESRDTNNYSPIVANTPMRIQTMLFFPDSTNGNNAQTYIGDVNGSSGQNLDSWLTSAGFTFPSTGSLPV